MNILLLFSVCNSTKASGTTDDQGYIAYDSDEGKSGFQMIKNEDGIWQVLFQPIQ